MPLTDVHGHVPGDWLADLDAFAKRLTAHPWGGDVDVRLVVADDIAEALEQWMQADEWEKDRSALAVYAGAALQVGGRAFVGQDGLWTVAIGRCDEKKLFLTLVGHELVEAVIEHRQRVAGEVWDGVSSEARAHVLWSEYVVERTRTEIARELGFTPSSQETCRALIRTLAATAKPAMVSGYIATQAWHDLMLMWARVAGRTDAGQQEEAVDLETFYEHGVMAEVTPLWRDLGTTLRHVFDQPTTASDELDRFVVPSSDLVFERRPRPPR